MAAPGDYLDVDDLKDVAAGGLVREDVLDSIFDISDIPTVFLDMIGTDGFSNPYSEWTEDKLSAPDLTNKKISGSDIVSTDNKATVANAKRVGNHAQISTKPSILPTPYDSTLNIPSIPALPDTLELLPKFGANYRVNQWIWHQ